MLISFFFKILFLILGNAENTLSLFSDFLF